MFAVISEVNRNQTETKHDMESKVLRTLAIEFVLISLQERQIHRFLGVYSLPA